MQGVAEVVDSILLREFLKRKCKIYISEVASIS